MVNFEKREKIDIVTFSENKINALVSDSIALKINKVFEIAGSKLIIDLSGIEFIDSSGFGCFLTIRRAAVSNYGTLKFANPGERIKELFRILHLNTIFDIHDELQECIKSFE
jgi:anti-sigma B factor antagonist